MNSGVSITKRARPGLEGRTECVAEQWSGEGPAEPRKALSKKKCRRRR